MVGVEEQVDETFAKISEALGREVDRTTVCAPSMEYQKGTDELFYCLGMPSPRVLVCNYPLGDRPLKMRIGGGNLFLDGLPIVCAVPEKGENGEVFLKPSPDPFFQLSSGVGRGQALLGKERVLIADLQPDGAKITSALLGSWEKAFDGNHFVDLEKNRRLQEAVRREKEYGIEWAQEPIKSSIRLMLSKAGLIDADLVTGDEIFDKFELFAPDMTYSEEANHLLTWAHMRILPLVVAQPKGYKGEARQVLVEAYLGRLDIRAKNSPDKVGDILPYLNSMKGGFLVEGTDDVRNVSCLCPAPSIVPVGMDWGFNDHVVALIRDGNGGCYFDTFKCPDRWKRIAFTPEGEFVDLKKREKNNEKSPEDTISLLSPEAQRLVSVISRYREILAEKGRWENTIIFDKRELPVLQNLPPETSNVGRYVNVSDYDRWRGFSIPIRSEGNVTKGGKKKIEVYVTPRKEPEKIQRPRSSRERKAQRQSRIEAQQKQRHQRKDKKSKK